MSAFWLGLLCIKALLLWRLIFGHFCFGLMYSLISSLTSSRWEVSAKGAVCHTCYKSNSVSGIIARNNIYEHCLKWSPQPYLSVCLLHHLSLSRSTVVCHRCVSHCQDYLANVQVPLTPYLNFKNPSNYLSARVSFSAIKKLVLPLSPTVHLVLRLSNFENRRMGDTKVARLTEVAGRFHSYPFCWLPPQVVRSCLLACCISVKHIVRVQYLMPSRQGQVRLVRSPFFWGMDILVWEKSRIHRSEDVRSGESKTKDTESRVGNSLG